MVRKLLVAGIAGACVVAAGCTAGECRADSWTFLQRMNQQGYLVYDTAAAVTSGWQICSMIDGGMDGAEVARSVYVNSSWADIPNMWVAEEWVVTAVEELCPEFDHRGESAPAPVPPQLVEAI